MLLRLVASKARPLGLVKSWNHQWTAREISILRRLYPTASREEICAAIPGIDWRRICVAARYYGIRREKRPYKITEVQSLDQVRLRCYEIKWTMRDLDEECRTKRYFQTRGHRSDYEPHRVCRRLPRRGMARIASPIDFLAPNARHIASGKRSYINSDSQ